MKLSFRAPPRSHRNRNNALLRRRILMKRNHAIAAAVLAILALFFSAPSARGQGSRHDGIVLGPQGRPVAGATIAVCTQPATITTTPRSEERRVGKECRSRW